MTFLAGREDCWVGHEAAVTESDDGVKVLEASEKVPEFHVCLGFLVRLKGRSKIFWSLR